MSQEELIDAFVKGYGELAQVCGYTTEQIEKAETGLLGSDGHLIEGQMYFYDRT